MCSRAPGSRPGGAGPQSAPHAGSACGAQGLERDGPAFFSGVPEKSTQSVSEVQRHGTPVPQTRSGADPVSRAGHRARGDLRGPRLAGSAALFPSHATLIRRTRCAGASREWAPPHPMEWPAVHAAGVARHHRERPNHDAFSRTRGAGGSRSGAWPAGWDAEGGWAPADQASHDGYLYTRSGTGAKAQFLTTSLRAKSALRTRHHRG